MKASELVALLQKTIADGGDANIRVVHDDDDHVAERTTHSVIRQEDGRIGVYVTLDDALPEDVT